MNVKWLITMWECDTWNNDVLLFTFICPRGRKTNVQWVNSCKLNLKTIWFFTLLLLGTHTHMKPQPPPSIHTPQAQLSHRFHGQTSVLDYTDWALFSVFCFIHTSQFFSCFYSFYCCCIMFRAAAEVFVINNQLNVQPGQCGALQRENSIFKRDIQYFKKGNKTTDVYKITTTWRVNLSVFFFLH